MEVRWVRQEEPHGCGLAALAMLTGQTYAATRADFVACLRLEAEVADGLFERHGHSFFEWDMYLTERGYAVARKFLWLRKWKRAPWPCEPFGRVHLCEVQHSLQHCGHMVVMLADGTVLDPATAEPKRLADYWRVNSVAAVVKRES